MNSSDSFLYLKSPFLPTITEKNIHQILFSITQNKTPSSVAVSFELVEIGIDLNHYYSQDAAWLLNTFNVNIASLDVFIFGYIMAPSLIIGSYIMEKYGAKEAFNRLCPPPTDEFLLKLNEYKSSNLVNSSLIFRSKSSDPKKGGLLIYEHCLQKLFSDDPMYLVGIESSRMNYLDMFSGLLNIQ